MNEDLNGGVGTPNPLNPSSTGPVGPVESEQPVAPSPAGPVAVGPEPIGAEQVGSAQMNPEQASYGQMTADQAGPADPIAQPSQEMGPMNPVAPMGAMGTEPSKDEMPAGMASAEPMTAEPMTTEMPAEPEPKGSIVEPKNKSHKKLAIVIAIICFLVAIGCAVAAILILKPFGGNNDAVPAAVSKLISYPPTNVKIDGTVTLTNNAETGAFGTLVVDFDTDMNTVTGESTTAATLTTTLLNGKEYSFDASELRTQSGDLYMKINGIVAMLQGDDESGAGEGGNIESEETESDEATEDESETAEDGETEGGEAAENENAENGNAEDGNTENTEGESTENGEAPETNCLEDENGVVNCVPVVTPSILDYLGLFDVIDDEWILIPNSDFSNVVSTTQVNAEAQCLINAVGDISNYSENVFSIYEANPFITYSTDNLAIAKKKDTLYKITIDDNNLANFVNAMSTSGFANDLYACMGYVATNTDVKASDLAAIVAALPEIYVEIDDNDNFTRVYLKMDSTDGGLSVVADLSFSYPTISVVVEAPTSYIEITQVLSQLFSQFYNVNVVVFEG